jgi:hypothetical protein
VWRGERRGESLDGASRQLGGIDVTIADGRRMNQYRYRR